MPALKYRTSMPKPDDPDILKRIAEATRLGHPLVTAATLAGIGEMTANDWRARGNDELALTVGGEPLSPHALFAWTLKCAEAGQVDADLGVVEAAISEAPSKGWVPAMTRLQRRQPQHFSERRELHVTGSVGINVNVLVTELPSEARAIALERAAAALRSAVPQLPPGSPELDPAAPEGNAGHDAEP